VWKTRKDFDRDLFESYRSAGLRFGSKIKPLGSQLLHAKPRKNRPPRAVSTTLAILDDLVLDAVFWSHSLSVRLYNSRALAKRRNFKRAIAALLMKISQDAMVVRNLIVSGYDVQAKNLLRSVDEHVDAIYVLCLRPDLCDEFVLTNDEQSANKFWWDHIRRARKFIDAELRRRLNTELVSEFTEFKHSERQMLSMAHHPSYVASTIPFMVPYEGTNVYAYLFGIPSEYSYRTGQFLFFLLAEMSMLIGFLDSDLGRLIGGRGGGSLQELIRKGRRHLIRMLLLLSDNWDAQVFSKSKSMEDHLRMLPP
jgi:hypothetical protein